MCGPINWLGGHWHISTMRTFVSYPLCLFFIYALFHFFHNFPFPACLPLPNRFCVLVQTMNDFVWTTNFSFITQHSYLVGRGQCVCISWEQIRLACRNCRAISQARYWMTDFVYHENSDYNFRYVCVFAEENMDQWMHNKKGISG